MYGLSCASIIAQKLLIELLELHAYTQHDKTSGFGTSKRTQLLFNLIVDDFGVKYVRKEHAQHLISILEKHAIHKDWTGKTYCGITLNWDYK